MTMQTVFCDEFKTVRVHHDKGDKFAAVWVDMACGGTMTFHFSKDDIGEGFVEHATAFANQIQGIAQAVRMHKALNNAA